MVIQVIQEKRRLNTGQKAGKAIGGALSSLANLAVNQGMENQENESIKRETGANLQGIRDPQTRQALIADELRQGRRYREASASQQTNLNDPSSMRSQGSFQDRLQGDDSFNQGGQFARAQGGRSPKGGSFQERLQEPGIYDQEREPEIGITERPYEEEPRKKQTKPTRQPQQRSQSDRTLEPKEATSGETFQLLDPAQIEQEGLRVADELTKRGKFTSREEGINLVLQNENAKHTHNQNIENERQKKQEYQVKYGNRAVESMEKLIPKSLITDEHRAYFQKLGEEAAKNNVNESDFQKEVAQQATQFANDIEHIQKGVKPSRLFNDIKGGFWGNNRTAAERKADMRIAIEPLKKLGFYDTIRATLQGGDLKYAPEEVESLLSDLSESTTKTLTDLPDFNRGGAVQKLFEGAGKLIGNVAPAVGMGFEKLPKHIKKELDMLSPKEFSQEQLSSIKNNLKEVFSKDPSTNLLLLRKAYEDKGVDWRTFKNQMNDMIMNGELKLNPDQLKQFNSYIIDPPEGPLSYILRQAHFIGR